MKRVALPIDPDLPRIASLLKSSRSLVIVAPPGAGKTTRVPVALLESNVIAADSEHPNIVMLQPRRVAARAAAMRIAYENQWEVGREVGYHVRFDRKIGRQTRLRVLTEGILTRQLLEDPFLEGIGAVILDEFHERSLHTDLAIALLREVQETVREDLKIIVMSATLEAQPVSKFLGDCPIVTTQGRTYPIEVRYSPTVRGREVDAAIAAAEAVIQNQGHAGAQAPAHAGPAVPQRDILVFMPGADEIRRVMRGLEGLAQREDLVLVPLFGALEAHEQDFALRPDPQGRRKIVVATNIAETSLTIDGVGVVIDSGLARVAGFDPERGLDRLDVQRISRASATQRAGRAGRTGPGVCIRLWSEKEWERMDEFQAPEILRVDLCATVLELAAWGKGDPRTFGWYEPPEERMLASAQELLVMLGAIDSFGKATPVGQTLASLPVHPRLGRLIVEAANRGLLREGATIAALVAEKDILREERLDRTAIGGRARMAGSSDVLARLHIIDNRINDPQLDRAALHQVLRVRDELLRMGERLGGGTKARRRHGHPADHSSTGPNQPATTHTSAQDSALRTQDSGFRTQDSFAIDFGDESELLRLVLWAYPDRVCRRRGGQDRAVMVGGGGVKLAEESVVRQGEFFVAVDARQDQRSLAREALVRIASAIDVAWLETMFPSQIRREQKAEFDPQRQRIVGVLRLWYRDLLLREEKEAAVDPATARQMLGEVVRQQAGEIFRAHEGAAGVIARVALLRQHMTEQPWPAWDEADLGEILASSLGQARNLREVAELPLGAILKSSLVYPMDRMLEKEAPEAMEVPSGSRIRLRYSANGEAVLAVRLQEIFGWLDTPRIAGGRVPVKLELLAPNFRPVQVTMDLRSFWTNMYFQVRKDLKARYPRHAWPDDPLTAKPEAKGGRRR